MGRRKISIQPITDERNRKVTFVKRKAGLFKKAHELAVLCQVDLAVIILGNNNNKFYEYSSVKIEDLLKDHDSKVFSHDIKTPGDYGDYELISRVQKDDSNASRKIHGIPRQEESSDDEEEEEDEEEEDDEKDDDPPSKKRKTSPSTIQTRSRVKAGEPLPAYNNSNGLAGPPIIHRQQPLLFQQHQQGPNQQYPLRPPQPIHSNYLPGQTLEDANRNYQAYYSNFPFSPGTPSSQRSEILPSISTPIVQNSSPFDSSARNGNKRPILRVQIPEDNSLKSPKRDSANTLTGGDISKNSEIKDEPLSTSGKNSADSNKPIDTSNRSTPISATLPSRGFALPPPQSSQYQRAMTGEQTPLTGGLPSKYVPDLFPSPSNFYSNEWNIPFGSGTTPYPNSAGPHQLPNVSGPPRLTKLPSLNADSPLQHFTKDKDKDKKDDDKEISGRKIDFKGT